MHAVVIEVDVSGVDPDQGLTALRVRLTAARLRPGSSPSADASVVRCEERDVAAIA
jgi:hypothetical protein